MYYAIAELALHPHYLKKVHEELDCLFPELKINRGRFNNPENDPNPGQSAADQLFGTQGIDLASIVTYERLSELKVLDCVIKEALRIHPPAPGKHIYSFFS